MADSIDPSAIASSILTDAKGLLEAKATGFLKDHPAALALLTKAASQMAEAMIDLVTETDPSKKAELRDTIIDDKDALKEEGFSIIVDVEATTKSLFWTILEDMGRIALNLVPVLLKSVPIPI
jgi:DNA transposition AAA+ family ATPase